MSWPPWPWFQRLIFPEVPQAVYFDRLLIFTAKGLRMMTLRLARYLKPVSAWLVVVLAGLAMVSGIAGCSNGQLVNPFAQKVVPTPVPSDFSVVIDRNVSTYFSRQHIRQVITASDMMSRTTFTNLSDYHNTITSQYTTSVPLNQAQLQHMWNEVCRNQLMRGALTWTSWYGPIDAYQRDSMTLQIRANKMEVIYHQLNHWDADKVGLVLACESVSLPVGQGVKPQLPPTPVKPVSKPAPKTKLIRVSPKPVAATQPATKNVTIKP